MIPLEMSYVPASQIARKQLSVLMRAFFYNSGMPDVSDSKEPASDVMSSHRLCQRVQRSLNYLVMHKPRQYPPILFGRIKRSHLGGQEQLVLLEVLFWAMWGFVPCSGSLVVAIFNTAYAMNLGSIQANNTHESRRSIEDCAAIWILITVEILELEALGEQHTNCQTCPCTRRSTIPYQAA